MKFVCDNCQAKYQIGDDKVAGKTVRMKCRKCGFNIKVSAASVGAPTTGAVAVSSAPIESMSSIGISAAELGDDDATALMSQSVREAVVAATLAGPASAPRPAPAPAAAPAPLAPSAPSGPPRPSPARPPSPAGSAIPRPSIGSPLAAGSLGTSGALGGPTRTPSGTMPRPAGITGIGGIAGAAGVAALSPAAPRPVSRTSTSSGSMAAVRVEAHPPHAAAVAPAPHVVQAPVQAPPHAAPASEHEWYVGIAGTPIGPVRVSVIRERAASREVDGESLVWREGMSEWRALKNYPELLAAVTEATAAAGTAAPVAAIAPAPVVAPAAPAPAPAPVAPVAPAAAPAAPIAVAPAALAAPAVPPDQPGAAAGPPAPWNAPNAPNAPDAPAAPVAVPVAVPVDAPPARAARAPVEKDDLASLEESLIPRRRGAVHPMAYAFVAAAAVFGGVAAWVLLRPQPPPQIVFVQPPAPVAPTPTAAATTDKAGEGDVQVGDIATGSSATAARPGVHSQGGNTAKAGGTATTPTTSTPVAAIDTSSFVNSVPGPAATGATPAGGGGQLSAGEISSVVAQNQAIIKRKCWQPALESKAPGSPANARVVGSLVIGPTGNVDSASTSGGDSFPGLASCIQQRMKNWHFPASGGTTPVQVPFVFAGQ